MKGALLVCGTQSDAGKSVVMLDPKGDLVEDILRRYPLKRLARIHRPESVSGFRDRW